MLSIIAERKGDNRNILNSRKIKPVGANGSENYYTTVWDILRKLYTLNFVNFR